MPTIGQPGRVASEKNTKQEITDAVFTTGSPVDPNSLKSSPVDWSSKTAKIDEIGGFGTLNVSGSGYLTGVMSSAGGTTRVTTIVTIDGTALNGNSRFQLSNDNSTSGLPLLHRFDSSLKVEEQTGQGTEVISYILD